MSEKVKARPLVRTGGASAFIQEVSKGIKLQYVSFVEGRCHRRIVLMTKVENVEDEKTGETIQVAVPGFAILHLLEDFMGVPVKNPGYSEEGIEITPDYTRTVYSELMGNILSFDEESYEPVGTVDLRTAYSNFIRYVEDFCLKFDPSKNTDRQSILVLRGSVYRGDKEDKNAIIRHLKDSWSKEVGADKYSDLFYMTFMEAVRTWILENTSMKIAFTPTANANFSGVPFYGALADPSTEEGEHQGKVIGSLSSVARVLSQQEFENTEDSADGLKRGTKAYNDAYNLWVSVPKMNRQLIGRPSMNGVIFVFDSLCDEKCKNLMPDERGNTGLRQAIHNVSPNKIEKIKKIFVYDTVLENPDFIDVVFKYTTGATKALMGQGMSVDRWEGSEETLMPFKDIAKYIEQTNSPNISDRINSYQPFPFEDFTMAFKKYLERLNSKGKLDFIKEDEQLKGICSRGFSHIGFDLNAKSVSVEDILKTGKSDSMAGMAANLGINFSGTAAPQPQVPQPQVPQPQVQQQESPQPQAQEIQQAQPQVPQPQIPQPQQIMPQIPQ